MDLEIYELTTWYVVLMDVVIALATLWLLKKGNGTIAQLVTTGFVFLCWIVILVWAMSGEHIVSPNIEGLTFYLVIIGFVLFAGILMYITGLLKVFYSASQVDILIVHGFRVFVAAGFFTEGALGVIPVKFGIMDGFMHMTSGFLALFTVILLLINKKAIMWVWVTNVAGLLDILIIATAICFFVFSEIGPHHNMMLAVFFAAPVLIWLHFTSLYKLIKQGL